MIKETNKQIESINSEELFRTIVESSHEIIIQVDKQGNFLFINKTAEDLTGFKIADFIGKGFASVVHPDDLQIAFKILSDSFAGKQSNYEIRIFNAKGEIIFLELNTSPINDNGNIKSVVAFCRDITKQKEAEEKLRISEITYRGLLNTVTEALYALDEEGKFVDVNETSEKMYGYEREYFLWQNSRISFCPGKNDMAKVFALLQDAFNGKPQMFEFWGIKKDGTVFPKDVSITAGTYFGKKVVIAVARDITERKRKEEELISIHNQHSFIFKSLPIAIYAAPVSPDVDVLWISESIFNVTGYTLEEYLSDKKFWSKNIHPDDAEKTIKAFKNASVLNEVNAEYRWKIKSGEYRWFLDKAFINKNNSGSEYFGILMDITESKNTELALIESKERYKAMIENIDQLVIEFDEKGTYLNIWAEDDSLLVIRKKSTIGKSLTEVLGNKLAIPVLEKIHRVISTGKPELFEYRLDVIGGSRWFSGRINPIFTADRKIKTVSFIARDITERKKAEEEIILKNSELEKINAEKDKFFSIIAHDLKSPFTGFLSFTDMMKNNLSSMTINELKNIAHKLNLSANNLYSLLNNLLEWALMQKGLISFSPENYNLKNIINDSIKNDIYLLNQKEISLHTDIPENLIVFIDKNMIEFALRNLFTNAIKFTNRKGNISIIAKPENNNEVLISVTDSGIGIDKELIKNLFVISEKVRRQGTESEPSTGLGLLLCKEFIEKNNGKITVESEEGKGSKFSFTLKRNPD